MVDEARGTLAARPPWVPGLASLRGVEVAAIPRELAAGVSVAAVALPVGLALAALMGVAPVYGLYASIFPMLAYALFGPSRFLIVGPDTATCLLVASALTTLGVVAPDQRIVAASALALIAGAGFALASVARLGFIANLLSRPILVGYMGGVALTLLISQIASFTGVEIESPGLFRPLLEVARRAGEIHWLTLALGVGCFVALVGLRQWAPRLPGHAIVVVGAILLSWGFDLSSHGVAVIGPFPSGLPALSLPDLRGRLDELGMAALSLILLSFVSGMMTARSFGQRLGVSSDGNLELRGFAAANIAASLFHGFPVTGGDSRTAVNLDSGGRTALAPIAAGLVLIIVLTTLTAPLMLLPKAALGAVLAVAALGLIDVKAFAFLARIGRAELVFALVAMAGVIWAGVLQGVFLAIAATFVYLLGLVARPRYSQMGYVASQTRLVPLDRHPEARPPEDGVVFIFEAALLFINADHFRERALAALQSTPGARWFVLDASAMLYADSTGIVALLDLQEVLEGRGVRFAIAGGHGRYRQVLDRAGFENKPGAEAIHPTTSAAVKAMRAQTASPEADQRDGREGEQR